MRSFLRFGLPWLAVCLVTAAAAASDRDGSVQRVAFAELLEAMRAEQGRVTVERAYRYRLLACARSG